MTKEEFKKIYKSFELKNEQKVQSMRMDLWGWQKMPDKIKHWKEMNGLISIPAGLRGYRNFENRYGEIKNVEHSFINNPFMGNDMDLKQNKVVSELLSKDIGLLHASTGVGKTMITAKIIKQKEVKTLIVVSGIELMNQMQNDLLEIFQEKYPIIHGSTGIIKKILIEDLALEAKIKQLEDLISDATTPFRVKKIKKKIKLFKESRKYYEEINEKKLSKILSSDIVIANIDTLVTLPKKEFFQQFDLTIMDEVDTYLTADRRREMIWDKATSKYIYGLTGTIKLNYIPDKIFDIYLGPKTELLIKRFQPKIYKVLSEFRYKLDDIKKFHELKEAVYTDESRNNLIVNTIKKTLGNKKGIVFSEYIEHAKLLQEKIQSDGIKCFLLIGEINDKERLEIKEQLKSYQGPCILIGSVKIVGRGFNVPELAIGYLTTAEKFKSNVEQYVGRIIRKFPGKTGAKWYDFVDPGCKTLFNQSKVRSTTYRKEFPESSIEFL